MDSLHVVHNNGRFLVYSLVWVHRPYLSLVEDLTRGGRSLDNTVRNPPAWNVDTSLS